LDVSKNQQPFKNKEIETFPIPPLFLGQPSVHYLLVRTNVGSKSGGDDPAKVTLLVDTGATHTILPVKVLNDLGYDTKNPFKWHPGLITGRGQTQKIPIVQISSFYCLGKQMIDFPVLAYTLPQQTYWDGVLGMDFLTHFEAVILLAKAASKRKNEIRLR
jgi:hypothetical protein